MCCDGKFLFFINMRICSLIFGWIIAVMTGIITLALFILDTIFLTNFLQGDTNQNMWTVPVVVITWSLVHVAIIFTATVLLLVGLLKHKPELLKGYMIYGMIHTLLFAIQVVILQLKGSMQTYILTVIAAVGIAIYVGILFVLFKTHKSMVNPNPHYPPRPLV